MIPSLIADFKIIFERDPAARNWLEILFCYPGFHAILLYRFAHFLHQRNVPFFPRLLSQFTRLITGIEIHPQAQIGKGVFIDHGMGVVIGETAIIGDYCWIYQGVTLGGTGKESGKRHPSLGKNVMVGAGAKILGNLRIGDNVKIGAGSVVLKDVPSQCTVVGIPGRIVHCSEVQTNTFVHDKLPDLSVETIINIAERLRFLEQQMQELLCNKV
jgi:serine O-acetyltransferase